MAVIRSLKQLVICLNVKTWGTPTTKEILAHRLTEVIHPCHDMPLYIECCILMGITERYSRFYNVDHNLVAGRYLGVKHCLWWLGVVKQNISYECHLGSVNTLSFRPSMS